MHSDLFYNLKHCVCFAVLPGCDKLDTLVLEIKLLETYLKITPITVFEHRRIGEGPYWGHSVLKFGLHPSVVVGNDDFTELTAENAKLITPEKYKLCETDYFNTLPKHQK